MDPTQSAPPLGEEVVGYRELTQGEIDKMNEIKTKANEVGSLIEGLKDNMEVDQRWLGIATDDLQKGFMSLVRSVAKPESF